MGVCEVNTFYELLAMYHSGDIVEVALWRIKRMFPLLNERQRRLYLACEARTLGSGGIAKVSRMTGVTQKTIYRGLKELDSQGSFPPGVRFPPKSKALKNHPGIIKDIQKIIEPEKHRGGNKGSVLSYTAKTSKDIAAALCSSGLTISGIAMTQVLKEAGYTLRTREKVLEEGEAQAQAGYIDKSVQSYMLRGEAVIFIDIMKTLRTKWGDEPLSGIEAVKHELEQGVPDVPQLFGNAGFRNIEVTNATAAFAAESLGQWWEAIGQHQQPYGLAAPLHIITRFYLGKTGLVRFQDLTDRLKMKLDILYLPGGIYKWSGIAHQAFLFSSTRHKDTAVSAAVIGLLNPVKIKPETTILDHIEYSRVQDTQNQLLRIVPHKFNGGLNFTMLPRKQRGRPPTAVLKSVYNFNMR
jgi:transposase